MQAETKIKTKAIEEVKTSRPKHNPSVADDYIKQIKTERHWKKVATVWLILFSLLLIGFFVYTYVPLDETYRTVKDWYRHLDKNFHWMLLAGFLAQMVDGALGMGYGVTSTAILLSTGISPAAISGSVHTSEVFLLFFNF